MHLKKIIKTKTICVCLVFFAYVSAYSQPFGGGSGTQQDPYQIYNIGHLEELRDSIYHIIANRNRTTNRHYILMNDITDSVRFTIGGNFSSHGSTHFRGYFNGNGFTITIALDSGGALFGGLDSNRIIENLNVDGRINSVHDRGYAAGICLFNYDQRGFFYGGIIRNCNNYATIDVDGPEPAGITVANRGFVIDCNNYGSIYFTRGYAGGICARNSSLVQNSNNYGLIQGRGYVTFQFSIGYVGGIVGSNGITGQVIGCNNYGEIDIETGFSVGGIVGHNEGFVSHCINSGNLKHDNFWGGNVGGIVGNNGISEFDTSSTSPRIIEFCLNIGSIKSISEGSSFRGGFAGGIAGRCAEERTGRANSLIGVFNNANYGFVEGIGKNRIGGIVGDNNYNKTVLQNNFNSGVVVTDDPTNTNIGCIIGNNNGNATLINKPL